jgi:hypothetical protein
LITKILLENLFQFFLFIIKYLIYFNFVKKKKIDFFIVTINILYILLKMPNNSQDSPFGSNISIEQSTREQNNNCLLLGIVLIIVILFIVFI